MKEDVLNEIAENIAKNAVKYSGPAVPDTSEFDSKSIHGVEEETPALSSDINVPFEQLASNDARLKESTDTNAKNIQTNVVDIIHNSDNIDANATNISNNDKDIASNLKKINTNVANIADNDGDIAENVRDIASNAKTIQDIENSVDKGSTYQVLTKKSNTDFDFVWAPPIESYPMKSVASTYSVKVGDVGHTLYASGSKPLSHVTMPTAPNHTSWSNWKNGQVVYVCVKNGTKVTSYNGTGGGATTVNWEVDSLDDDHNLATLRIMKSGWDNVWVFELCTVGPPIGGSSF